MLLRTSRDTGSRNRVPTSTAGQTFEAVRASRPAFTLIEMIVSMSVGVIISGAAAMMLWNAAWQRAELSARGELCDQAAAALETLLPYVREIPQDECPGEPIPCLHGRAQISRADLVELRFGNTGCRLNPVLATLEMTVNGGVDWNCLTREVLSIAFSYYDRQGNILSSLPLSPDDREAVRQVGVDLWVSRGGQDVHLRSRVYLRNFMDEVAGVP